MPPIRTDDGPRSLRAVWLGPKGMTWPMEWSYARWAATFLASTVTLPVFVGLFWFLTRAVLFAPLAGAVCGLPAAVWLGARVTAGLSMDQPITYRAGVVAGLARLARTPVSVAQRFEIPKGA